METIKEEIADESAPQMRRGPIGLLMGVVRFFERMWQRDRFGTAIALAVLLYIAFCTAMMVRAVILIAVMSILHLLRFG